MLNVVEFGIICRCKMNVRTRQNCNGCGIRHGHDSVGFSRRLHDPMHTILCTGACPSSLFFDTARTIVGALDKDGVGNLGDAGYG